MESPNDEKLQTTPLTMADVDMLYYGKKMGGNSTTCNLTCNLEVIRREYKSLMGKDIPVSSLQRIVDNQKGNTIGEGAKVSLDKFPQAAWNDLGLSGRISYEGDSKSYPNHDFTSPIIIYQLPGTYGYTDHFIINGLNKAFYDPLSGKEFDTRPNDIKNQFYLQHLP